jgi:quercetin dioxygenase-like cupin family protein
MIVRLYTGSDGESHFEEIAFDYAPHLPLSERTAPEAAETIHFARHFPGYSMDWHPAPRRQYVVFLGGQNEITVRDGTKLVFKAGDILLAEDTGSQHYVRVIGDEPRLSLTVPLQDD